MGCVPVTVTVTVCVRVWVAGITHAQVGSGCRSGCRFRLQFPFPGGRPKCRRSPASGAGRNRTGATHEAGRPSSATAAVISLRSPRAGGCKSSPTLTFFNLRDPPLIWPQRPPAGRARPVLPWKGPNWCAAAVGVPAAPQASNVPASRISLVTDEV